jgi:hypothetical protein
MEEVSKKVVSGEEEESLRVPCLHEVRSLVRACFQDAGIAFNIILHYYNNCLH